MKNKQDKAMSWLNENTGGALVPPAQIGTSLSGPMDRIKIYHYRVAKGDKCCQNCKFMAANKACEKFISLGIQPIKVENGMVCDLFQKRNPKDEKKEKNKTDYEAPYETEPEGKSLSTAKIKKSPFTKEYKSIFVDNHKS